MSDVEERIAAFEATLPFVLDPFQREAIEKLEHTRGVIVSAPTASGKTMIAEYAIWRRLAGRQDHDEGPSDVVYTTPLKALSNQKYHELQRRYGENRIGLVTGEHTINDGAPVVVMTTEILRNIVYDEPARVDRVGTVVLDEVHYIDDAPRGTVWEEIIIEAPRHIRLIGLSATISNVGEVAAWMSEQRGPIATVVHQERPVPLEMWLAVDNRFHPLFDERGNADRRTIELAQTDSMHGARFRFARNAPENDLLQVIGELQRRRMLPVIYFIFSRRGCREALERCALHGVDLTSGDEKRVIDAAFRERVDALQDDDERRCVVQAIDRKQLRRGVAMHHAGMLPYAKELIEQLFQQGLIKVVFATETLSLGLNMPARSCVISTFSKFDGTSFATLTSGELTQLMGRAGRRGIDPVGHGVVLKESEVDVRDIYDAAISGEFAVQSRFTPSYGMVLSLLRTRTAAEAENLLERSFGQFQTLSDLDHWSQRKAHLETRLADLRQRHFRHPRVACSERTLSQFMSASSNLGDTQAEMRRLRREHWQSRRRARGGADPGGRLEALRRSAKRLQARIDDSPCPRCPFLGEHRAHRHELQDVQATLDGGEAELETAKHRFRREFRALSDVLRATGFLDGDSVTDLGMLAEHLFGERALIVADSVSSGVFDGLEPPDLAATLVMLVAEDRGRDRPHPSQHRFPSSAVAQRHRSLRSILHRFATVEQEHGVDTMRPLSLDFVTAAHRWTSG
ncbi:MAG: DEAD/DEAH box helicase, partial [Candidatus Dormibacteraeota bacterium]|nr:DEAD/DEAH box helicase [Candidatus Dormibacteraeota bacterium]